MRAGRVAIALVLAACDSPPFSLRFALTAGETQTCFSDIGNPTASCADVTMLCDAVLSVRVIAPSDPRVPYISVCEPLRGAQDTLCAIGGVDLPLPDKPVPEQILEVQMAVFPRSAISTDPVSGDLICPIVDFDLVHGFPVTVQEPCAEPDISSCPMTPAVGGRAFYYPGDEKTVVRLGCTNLGLLQDPSCTGANNISVTATVNDFDNANTSVSNAVADRLTVSIGEPRLVGDVYLLEQADTRELDRVINSTPAWSASITDLTFSATKCLEVLENVPQSTSTVTCAPYDSTKESERIDMSGVRLSTTTLNDILSALGKPIFPAQGLVVGMVVDNVGNPVAGATVTPSDPAADILYLSATTPKTVTTTSTSTNGIFISRTAPFGTRFGWTPTFREGHGGLVEGKVTIVLVQESGLN